MLIPLKRIQTGGGTSREPFRSPKNEFARHRPKVIVGSSWGDETPKLRPSGSPENEVKKHKGEVIGGSSWGDERAMNSLTGDVRLMTLCPAWKKWGKVKPVDKLNRP
jgi:hypothetical protein